MENKGRMVRVPEWRMSVATLLLRWIYKLCKKTNNDKEHEELLDKCNKVLDGREDITVLRGDELLLRETHEPSTRHMKYYLRAWLRTRELVIKEYQICNPGHVRPTLHKWLVRREEDQGRGAQGT